MLVVKHKVKTTLPIIDVAEDTIVFKEGGQDRRMFLVLEGSVKLYNEVDEKEVEVAVVKKHQFFGEIEMYVDKPRSASARVLTNAKLVVIRSPKELEHFANDNHWLTGTMMETMGERQLETNALLAAKILSAPVPVTEFDKNTGKELHGESVEIVKISKQ